jgi:Holliday junction resolvase-like predicted endonuclease
MGFDTYLQVDDRIVLMWRKHAGVLPRLLFRFQDLQIADAGDTVGVSFRATAADARDNLEQAGLGWGAAVAGYADTRFGGYSAGMMLSSIARASADDVERQFEAFESLPADQDLVNLGMLMAQQWLDEKCREVALLSDLSYDGDLPPPHDAAFGVMQEAQKRGVDNPFAVARAAESMAFLDRTAPMLVWPLIVCVFLQQLPDDAVVELVLTEDAQVSADVNDEESAREYAAGYWTMASDALAREARTLERLFAVLAGSSAAAGPEFWFARAADLLGRVHSLRSTIEVTTRARGDALESLVDAILRTEEPELQVIEKNLRTREEEIDLVLANGLRDPFWLSLSSPLILVECKNWSKKAGVEQLRVLESKMLDRKAMCRIAFFVSLSGFTSTFLSRLTRFSADGGVIFAIDGDDLATLVRSKRRITDWLRVEGLRRSLSGRT